MIQAAPQPSEANAATGPAGGSGPGMRTARGLKALAAALVAAAAAPAAVWAQGGTLGAATWVIALIAALACAVLARPSAPTAGGGGAAQPPGAAMAPRATTLPSPGSDPLPFDNRAGEAPRGGAALMAAQVVPVWQRQLEASRALAEQGVGGLLESFNAVSTGLQTAVDAAAAGQGQLGVGTADELLERNQSLIDELLQPVATLRSARADTEHELAQLAQQMQAFQHAAKELDGLARHARLVAMNAAIEANRAGQSQGGFGAVAREVLELSTHTGTSAQRLLERFSQAQQRLDELRRRHELDTGNDETAQLALRQRARQLIVALVGDMSRAMAGSRELREAGTSLQQAMDDVFMGFQFQDRFSQMMGSVTSDMERFAQWLADGGGASHADAAAWLKRLDASYTMEEQRSHHHGTVQIARGPEVDYF